MEIHPNTLATELRRTTMMHTGARQRINRLYIFLRLKADDFSTSSSIRLSPTTRVTKKQVARAAMGIIRELVRKSKKSRMDIPKRETKSRTPKPRAEAESRKKMITPITAVAL